jgi:hypothetical protein
MRRLLLVTVASILIPAGTFTAKADAGAVPISRVKAKSNSAAHRGCQLAQWWYHNTWRCEGWAPGACYRQSLVRPNHVFCVPYFFMSRSVDRNHMDCTRKVHFYAGKDGKGPVRVVKAGTDRRWTCTVGTPS